MNREPRMTRRQFDRERRAYNKLRRFNRQYSSERVNSWEPWYVEVGYRKRDMGFHTRVWARASGPRRMRAASVEAANVRLAEWLSIVAF